MGRHGAWRSMQAAFGGLLVVLSVVVADRVLAAEQADAKSAEAAIRANAGAFVDAFNRNDAKAVAALWTEDGTMTNDAGRIIKGRKAIEDDYAAFFKQNPGVRLEVAVDSIVFPTESVAIEDGLARAVKKGGASPSQSRYNVVHVLKDGKWLMAGVRDSQVEVQSNYPHLQVLEWLVGNWRVKSGDVIATSDICWVAGGSFLERKYIVRKNGLTTASGVQIVGWDPRLGKIRSWSFDSAGGHGIGVWTATPDGWQIDQIGVLTDSTPTASRDSVIRTTGEQNVFGWRSVDRRAGRTILADMPEVVFERVSAPIPKK